MSLNATVSASINFRQTGNADFGPQRFEASVRQSFDLANGVTAGKADILFADERTLASGANDDLDLAGVLQSAFGQVVNAAKIVAVLLINRPSDGVSVNTTNLTMGGASNPVPGLAAGPIGPGGIILLADPDLGGLATVTAGTGDILRIANSAGAPATYQIVILAKSA